MKLSPIARDLTRRLSGWDRKCDWYDLRNEIDVLTGSAYPTMVLDRLTDMVQRRLPFPTTVVKEPYHE